MSAEVLREAARLMRERAGNAGAYEVGYRWAADVREDGWAWVGGGADAHAMSLHGLPNTAIHIASWHPAVALAAALGMECTAEALEARGVCARIKPAERAWIDFARAYLNEVPS